jgi:hypothetical protein
VAKLLAIKALGGLEHCAWPNERGRQLEGKESTQGSG